MTMSLFQLKWLVISILCLQKALFDDTVYGDGKSSIKLIELPGQ